MRMPACHTLNLNFKLLPNNGTRNENLSKFAPNHVTPHLRTWEAPKPGLAQPRLSQTLKTRLAEEGFIR